MPRATIKSSVGSAVYNGLEDKRRQATLERFAKHVLYRAMFVLQAYLRLMRIGMIGVYGVRMRVQLQQKGIRYHGPAEKQKQE